MNFQLIFDEKNQIDKKEENWIYPTKESIFVIVQLLQLRLTPNSVYFWAQKTVLFSSVDKRRGGRWCCVLDSAAFIKRVKKAAMPTETVLIRENFFAHRTKSTKTSCILGTPLTSQTLLYTRLCWHTRTDWNAAVLMLHTLSIQFHVHQWLLTLLTNDSEMRFVP